MDKWEQLNKQRIHLEDDLLTAEREIELQQNSAQPNPALMHELAACIDCCLERLKSVNDGLARMRPPHSGISTAGSSGAAATHTAMDLPNVP